MNISKVIISIVWLACAACLLLTGDSTLLTVGRSLFWILLVVHLIEFFVYLPGLKRLGEPMAGHFIQVLLFGIVHWKEVQPRVPAE
jgi:uncharacterized protein YhhL (DUF1145 family)